MGFSICFFAAKVTPEAMAKAFGLRVSQIETELPMDYWWVSTFQKSGWTVLWAEDFDFGQAKERNAVALSVTTDVMLCEVDVNVGYSSAWFWSKGRLRWKVAYLQETDTINDLEIVGELPAEFESIRERLVAIQTDLGQSVDTAFSLPLSVGEAITGYVYDNYPGPGEMGEYLVVEPEASVH
jgi:hypothetical protein